MTLDGGTIVGAAAIALTAVTEVTRRRAAAREKARQEQAKDTHSALESWDDLVARHQHDYERIAADYEKKRDEYHQCRNTVRAWELWAGLVCRQFDLPKPLADQYDALMRGDDQ